MPNQHGGREPDHGIDADGVRGVAEWKAAAGVPKAALARHYGISRETVYTYLRAEV